MMDIEFQRLLKYPFVLLAGFLVTYLLTPGVRWLAPRLGFVDMPGARHIHKQPVPRCGVSVFLGFHAACASVFLLPWLPFGSQLTLEWWRHYLVVSSVLLVVGLADDWRGLNPWVKLAGQILAASLAFHFQMRVGKILGFPLPPILDYAATLVWFLALINAFNLIDGIDGLATGLAGIAAAGIAGSFLFRHVPGDALILFGFMGACFGFLRYNFQPASIFLGDSGSMFLGLTLAAIAPGTGAKGTALTAIGVPLLAVGIPLLDTLLAVWRRTARRFRMRLDGDSDPASSGNIFQGDTDHLHHRLVRTGLSHRATATALYLMNGALVAVGLLSVIFRSRAVGIYTLAFVAGTYVAMRYLVGPELWDSGIVISQGIRRPKGKRLQALLAPVWDVIALCLALAIACVAGLRDASNVEFQRFWFDQIPLWVGIPFLFLVGARIYRRIWSLARPSEYVLLAAALLAGILAASGVAMVLRQFSPPMQITILNLQGSGMPSVVMGQAALNWLRWQVIVYIACAVPLIVGMRLLPRLILDAVSWAAVRPHAGGRPARNLLIYGAGVETTLYLQKRGFDSEAALTHQHIVGLIDDDPTLQGRYVGGHPVLGTLQTLPTILDSRRIHEIVVTAALPPETQRHLTALAEQQHVAVQVWRTVLTTLSAPAAS